MKTFVSLLFCSLFCLSMVSAQGGFGFLDISYATINEDFIDRTSEGFGNPELQLNENGIGIGGSGLFIIQKFVVGGGGGLVVVNSDNSNVSMNIGHGYGFAGWDFSSNESMIVAASLRLGTFGNTLKIDVPESNAYTFGTSVLEPGATELTSGSFSFGIQVDVIKTFEIAPGLAVGLTAYYNAPISALTWQLNEADIAGLEQGEYNHYGLTLKIGGGAFNRR